MTTRLVALVALFLFAVAVPALAGRSCDTRAAKMRMLKETVRIEVAMEDGRKIRGSGIVISSRKKRGIAQTLILTNFHIVWPEEFGSDSAKANRVITAQWFVYDKKTFRLKKIVARRATVYAYDGKNDFVILEVKQHQVSDVATMSRRSDLMFEKVYVVGAGGSKPPFASAGEINMLGSLDDFFMPVDPEGEMIQHSAPIIYGNSGGGLYLCNSKTGRYEMVGLITRIETIPVGSRFSGMFGDMQLETNIPVPHISYAIPIPRIMKFLRGKRVPLQ